MWIWPLGFREQKVEGGTHDTIDKVRSTASKYFEDCLS